MFIPLNVTILRHEEPWGGTLAPCWVAIIQVTRWCFPPRAASLPSPFRITQLFQNESLSGDHLKGLFQESGTIFSPLTQTRLFLKDLRHPGNSVCTEKLSAERGKLLWVGAERHGDIQTAAGLACSGAAGCFIKGKAGRAPWQIHTCNWKRLAVCVSLRPQRFCLHIQRDSDPYALSKTGRSISRPDVTTLLLHWSIGCEGPWEQRADACLPRRSLHIRFSRRTRGGQKLNNTTWLQHLWPPPSQ